MRRGVATMPLHYGRAPRWLFERMVRLTGAVVDIILAEHEPLELLRRMSDPVWFQSLGCVVGFDWHSSGVTTTVCGALKEAIKGREVDLGVFVCGGKGAASRRTPEEIRRHADRFGLDGEELVRASRLSAKVDSSALQDGFQVYHHVFVATADGDWSVVQQGMNERTGWARRYHWLSDGMASFISDPHRDVACDQLVEPLNLVAAEAERLRSVVVELAQQRPERTGREYGRVRQLAMPSRHPVIPADVSLRYLGKVLVSTYEAAPDGFDGLLLVPGVGPKTLRALALVAEVAFGAKPSYRDPVTYSFALGGKDGFPYPVNRSEYDRVNSILERAVKEARLGREEKLQALRRLERHYRRLARMPGPTGRLTGRI